MRFRWSFGIESPCISLRASMASAEQIAASGVVAGIVTKTACAPLDRIRLLYQMQGMLNASDASKLKYQGIGQTVQLIVREEGVRGLWRGNFANMIRAAAVYTLKFGTNDLLKMRMAKRDQTGTDGANFKHSLGELLSAGAVAGFVQKVGTYPLDLISVRIAMGKNNEVLGAGQYTSIPNCINRIYSREGIAGFYKGLVPTIFTGVPYVTLQVTFFDLYRRYSHPTLTFASLSKKYLQANSDVA